MRVGLVLPMTDAGHGLVAYGRLRAIAQQADENGLDSLWVSDHVLLHLPQEPERRTWESWTILTSLAAVTTRVQLGPLVLCAPFRNPVLVAKMALTLAETSGGRLILGVGAGWHRPEFEALGIPFDHLVTRFEQYLAVLAPLLADESSAGGRRVKLLVGGEGPRVLQAAARYGHYWNTSWLNSPTEVAQRRRGIELACRVAGRDPEELALTVGANISAERPPRPLTEAVNILDGYEAAGVSHLMCSLAPLTEETLSWFARAVSAHRSRSAH